MFPIRLRIHQRIHLLRILHLNLRKPPLRFGPFIDSPRLLLQQRVRLHDLAAYRRVDVAG